nr:MAG TPA_asm: hypothetical protein [Caudoviricetes sp.]
MALPARRAGLFLMPSTPLILNFLYPSCDCNRSGGE